MAFKWKALIPLQSSSIHCTRKSETTKNTKLRWVVRANCPRSVRSPSQRDQAAKPEWAIVPYEEYLKMVEQVEMLADIRDYDEAKTAIENGAEEIIPSEVVNALMEGGNPVRIWREHRQMTQQELSEAAGISTPFLSQIETGKRAGSVKVLTKIAGTLNVAIEDLLI